MVTFFICFYTIYIFFNFTHIYFFTFDTSTIRVKITGFILNQTWYESNMVFPSAKEGRNGKSIMSSAKILYEWQRNERRIFALQMKEFSFLPD